jgi:hypothetical protein
MKRKSIALLAAVAVLSLPACGETDEDPGVTDGLTDTSSELTLPPETEASVPADTGDTGDTGDMGGTTLPSDTGDTSDAGGTTDTTGGMDAPTTTTSG